MTNNQTKAMVSGFGQYHSCERNSKNKTPYIPITFNKIKGLVDRPPSTAKEDGRWFIPSTLMSRTFKDQETNGEFHCLWADFDTNPKPVGEIFDFWQEMSAGCDAEVYTTRSATKDSPKSRIIIPLDKPISGADWIACQEILNSRLIEAGMQTDNAATRAAQLCYLPNKGEFYDAKSSRNGYLFNPLLSWSSEISLLHSRNEQVKQEQEARRKASEEKREQRKTLGYETVIDAFNAAYTVEDVLDRAGYDTDGNDNWRHPNSESGSYSARINNARVFSLSAADPLYTGGAGNGAHDAYGAFTVLFANGDSAIAYQLAQNEWLADWKFNSAKKDFDDLSGNGEPFDINAYFADLTLQDEDVEKMAEAEFLISDMIVRGHVGAYIAPGNGGKTTLFLFLCEQLAAKGLNVLYVNVDGSPGDLKRHYEHAKSNNYKVVAPDAKSGKSTEDVKYKLESLARSTQSLDNVVLIIDTLKKFVDVIAKRDLKAFNQLMRTLTVRGATICLLGHANKYKDENGRHIYEGTADLRNDIDDLIYINSVSLENPKRLEITTDPDKVRADFKPKSYIIDLENGRRVEECKEAIPVQAPDMRAVTLLIKAAINEGNLSQKAIVEYVMARCIHGTRKIKQILHDNTGETGIFRSRQTGRAKDLEYSIREIATDFDVE